MLSFRNFHLPFILGLLVIFLPHASQSSVLTDDTPSTPDRRDYKEELDAGLMPIYVQAEWFLGIVQLSYLYDLEKLLGYEFKSLDDFWNSWAEDYDEWLEYLIGFTICACVGVILLITMSIVGGVIACCRCCGKCGGKNPPDREKRSNCVVIGCGTSLLIVTLAMVLGVMGMFASNEVVKDRLQGESGGQGGTNVLAELIMSLEAIEKYFDSTSEELNTTVLGGYRDGQKVLFERLDEIGTDALMALDAENGVVGNVTELYEFTMHLEDTKTSMELAVGRSENLTSLLTELDAAIMNSNTTIWPLLDGCNTGDCDEARTRLGNLAVGPNVTVLEEMKASFEDAIDAIDLAITNGIVDNANSSRAELQKIVNTVNTDLEKPINDTKAQTDDIEKEIAEFIAEVEAEVDKIDLSEAVKALDDVQDVFDYASTIAYWCFLTLGVIVSVIILCNFVGLGAGSFCPQPTPYDKGCDCSTAAGADWLLAGLSFTFVFYWLFVVIVMGLFLGGGVPHTELCRHLINLNDSKSVDVLKIYDRMINDSLYAEIGFELEVFELYRDCSTDTSFYNALNLDSRGYNISEIIDLSPVEDAVASIKNVSIDIPSIELIDDAFKDVLEALDGALKKLDFESYLTELQKPIVTENLDSLAQLLNDINDDQNISGLEDEAEKLRNLNTSHVEPSENLVSQLDALLKQLQTELNINLTAIAANLDAAETTINDNGNVIIAQIIDDTADSIFMDVETFAADLESSVRDDVGQCYSLYEAITEGVDATCVKTLYPIHAFWYSLGWILLFLLPSIILSFKLVTQYRIQKDPYEGNPLVYDAFETPHSTSQTMLLKEMESPVVNGNGTATRPPSSQNGTMTKAANQKAGDVDSGVGEFDNPMYMNADGKEFHIPRPSMISAGSDTTSADFKIPRPQIYDEASLRDSRHSRTSSYYSTRERDSYYDGGAHPVVNEDTQL